MTPDDNEANATRLEVHKFGGTSVGSAPRILRLAELVEAVTARVVVVVSAMSGVTNQLVEACARADRREDHAPQLDAVSRAHEDALKDLRLDASPVAPEVRALLVEAAALLSAAAAVGAVSPAVRDRVLATGEKMSARLVAAAMTARGRRPAQPVDADTFLETDDRHGEASPLFGVMEPAVRASLRPLLAAGVTPVVTGFTGRAPTGGTTTLGRGGSDYSATLLASALDADEVTIWTDVPGVYSAHPRDVPAARIIPRLHYREAGELAFYGAKVLHPRTLQPVIDRAIPTLIRSSFDPHAGSTLVDRTVAAGDHPVKGVSAVPGQAMVTIDGTGMAGVPGIARRIFAALAERDISVTMISQSSAESSVSMAIPAERAADAEIALRRAFRTDLARGDVEDIRVQPGVSLVAVVGLGMAHTPGVAGRVLAAVASAGVNVIAIAQGASELNISFAVLTSQCPAALRAVHAAFALGDEPAARHADIALLGFGRIGRRFARMLDEQAAHIARRYRVAPRLVAIADRSGCAFFPDGLRDAALRDAIERKAAGGRIADWPGAVASNLHAAIVTRALAGPANARILVDAGDGDTSAIHAAALLAGACVATANKVPLAGNAASFAALRDAAARGRAVLRHEATVGAGLPIIEPIEQLLATGDRVTAIEGCVSGSLTFVLGRLAAGEDLDTVVDDATRLGYLEPDPSADLCGEDVRRKALILARAAGFDPPDHGVVCRGLADRALLGRGARAFADALPAIADDIASLMRDAREAGRVLRYVARITRDAVDVGPAAVDPSSPLAALTGTDNLVAISSQRYADAPLVIRGPGAGEHVTAAGLLGDVIRLVAEKG